MVIEEHFDADEILRDVDERYEDDEASELEEEMRELNFAAGRKRAWVKIGLFWS